MLAEKNAVKRQPCISVAMPFDPKMKSKTVIRQSLINVTDQLRRKLHAQCAEETAEAIMVRLSDVLEHLDYSTHKRSIAIFVSSELKKVCYLDIEMPEKIRVDTSFGIRDIVLGKKNKHEYLVLVLSGKKERIYIGNETTLQLVVSNNSAQVGRNSSEPVIAGTDGIAIKETRLKKFFHYIDNTLPLIFNMYPLPLFVMTAQKNMDLFQKIARHHKNITAFVQGNFDDATQDELLQALAPHLNNWKGVREKYLMNSLRIAGDNRTLSTGIHDVWVRANRKHKQLLIIEKDFYCSAFVTEQGEPIFSNIGEANSIVANDAVDDTIEKVLANGGDVEFVDDLHEYNRIALIDN